MAAFDGDAVGLLVAAGRPRARLSNDKWIHKAARHPRERASPRERLLFGMHGVDTNDRFYEDSFVKCFLTGRINRYVLMAP